MKKGLLVSVLVVGIQGLLFGADSLQVELIVPGTRTLAEQNFYDAALDRLRPDLGRETCKIPSFSSLKTNQETGKNLCRVKYQDKLVALVGVNKIGIEGDFIITLYAASPTLQKKERQALVQLVLQFARDDLHALKTTVMIRKRRDSTSSGTSSE